MCSSQRVPPPQPALLYHRPHFSQQLLILLFPETARCFSILRCTPTPWPRGISSTCLPAFVTRLLPLPRARSPRSPSAHLPSCLSVLSSEPFLLHVWHVPCVCRLSCSLPAPFQDRTKERKGWPWLHSLLLLTNAGAKTAGPCKHFC